jgi:three-Cys-motif partner protein
MGRASSRKNGVKGLPLLFGAEELPELIVAPEKDFRSLRHPLWTENKAKLIQEYIRLFTYITKHGTYIDGFAAPQRRDRLDFCSANLVLNTEPKRVRDFWLGDIAKDGLAILEDIASTHRARNRRVTVLSGDFNETVDQIIQSGQITEKTATFALLDQRTFECAWSTVQKLAGHKTDRKIEIFYFLATGWLDRSIKAVKTVQTGAKLLRWWGRDDWKSLQGVDGILRAKSLADRFKSELGYASAYPYAIHDSNRGGRTMYHMIHATDHQEAPPLMQRAYRKVSGRSVGNEAEQIDLDTLWKELEAGAAAT